MEGLGIYARHSSRLGRGRRRVSGQDSSFGDRLYVPTSADRDRAVMISPLGSSQIVSMVLTHTLFRSHIRVYKCYVCDDPDPAASSLSYFRHIFSFIPHRNLQTPVEECVHF